eukprot:TRINITY_DN1900_c0_g1_i1.p1 TRINITY_DN1900_c0_g1~~TRINITY_DN1900_c0_g1_i1.p1  ORF type:complete len:625 (-),score=135.00 TRINITY_DN1900_c0_g1_i1:17-1891(-)
MSDSGSLEIELEHAIGCNGTALHTVVAHSREPKTYFYTFGSLIVIANIDDPHEQKFLRRHAGPISVLSLSNSTRYLASGEAASSHGPSSASPVYIWDLETQQVVFELPGHLGGVDEVAWSPDDKFFLTCGGDRKLAIHDMQTGAIVGGIRSPDAISYLCWIPTESPNPRRPIYRFCALFRNQVKVFTWAFDIRAMQFVLNGTPCAVPGAGLGAGFLRDYPCAVVDESGTFCLAGTNVGEIVVYNVDTAVFKTTVSISKSPVFCLVKGHADVAYVGSGDGTVKKVRGRDFRWEVEAETVLDGEITSLSMCVGGREMLAATSKGKIYRMLATDLSFMELCSSHSGEVVDMCFASRSDIVSTISSDGTVRSWDLSTYASLMEASCGCGGTCLQMDQHGNVISGWEDGHIRCHDGKSGKLVWEIVNAHRGPVSALCVAEHFIVSGGEDRIIRVWTSVTHELVTQFTDQSLKITGVAQDFRYPFIIHSISVDRTFMSFDLKKSRRIGYHPHPNARFLSMTQRKDHEFEVLASTSDGRVVAFDEDIPESVGEFAVSPRFTLDSISMSPSGKFLATGGGDGILRVIGMCIHMYLSQSIHTMWICEHTEYTQWIICACIYACMLLGWMMDQI